MRAPVPSTPPVLPKISIRFFRRDLMLVLRKMWYVTRPTGIEFPWVPERPTEFVDELGAEIPQEVWNKRIESLWNCLFSLRGAMRPRLKLDFIDLSLCQLSVRALSKQVRHKHLAAPRPDYVVASQRFLKILEGLRKRARRAAARLIGKYKYDCITKSWRQYECDLRHGINCRCNEPRDPGAYNYSRFVLDKIVKIADQELRAENLPVPDGKKLRRWGQLLLHNIRRHREGTLNTPRLIESPAGRSCIRFFMRRKAWDISEKEL